MIEVRKAINENPEPVDTATSQMEDTDAAEAKLQKKLLEMKPELTEEEMGYGALASKLLTDPGYFFGGVQGELSQYSVDQAHIEDAQAKREELAKIEEAKRAELAQHRRDAIAGLVDLPGAIGGDIGQ